MLAATLLTVFSSVQAAEVSADLDRANVVVGETLTLTLKTADTDQSLDTDLSVLEQDFDVLDQRTETQMSIVNGRKSADVRLVVTLEPKHAGDLVIPALNFPGARSQPLEVHVSPAPQPAPGEPQPIFIELSVKPAKGPYYVHSQVELSVRIFYQTNLTEAAINPPAPKQAQVRLLDEVPYQAERNGVQYRVLERRYAVFPERSGSLEIPPMQLTGRLIERPSNSLWQPTVRGRRVHVDSKSLRLDIKPRPAAFAGKVWLPARSLTLSEQISDPDKLHVGEPVTRTIIMDAVGLEDNMLEEPRWPDVPDTRIYPDQPQGITRDNGEWVLGHKEFRYAVVPEKAGELVLPEIKVEWWDTTANRPRTAVVPAHSVKVLPSNLTAAAVGNPPAPESAAPAPATGRPAARSVAAPRPIWWQAATGVFAVLWLVTLFFYSRRSRPPRQAGTGTEATTPAEAKLLRNIQQACSAGDAPAARRCLSQWVRHHAPDGMRTSMRDYGAGCGDETLRRAIEELDAAGFGDGDAAAWNGKELWQAFRRWRGRQREPGEDDVGQAPDLYAR